MALEKFIRGKIDENKHAGRASEVRRIDEANQQIKEHGFYDNPIVQEKPIVVFPLNTAEPYRGRGGLNE